MNMSQKSEVKKIRRWEGGLTSHVLRLTSCVLLFLFVGCGTAVQTLKPSKNIEATAGDILKRVEGSRQTVNSLKGMAKVRLTNSKIDASVNEVVVIKRPSSIRLETLGFFGSPVMVFATEGESFSISSEKKFVTGRLSSKRIASLPFPFNLLTTDEITSIFLGSPPIIDSGSSELAYVEETNSYLMTLNSREGIRRQKVWIDAGTLQVVKTEIEDDGLGSTLTINFRKYQDIKGSYFPKEIEVSISPNPSTLRIGYEDIDLNVPVDNDIFLLTPTEGTEIVDLKEGI